MSRRALGAVETAALARACDLIREARHRQFGGMPMAILCDLLDDMARLHADHPERTRTCEVCGVPFVATYDHNRYCRPACHHAAMRGRPRRAA